MECLCIAPLPIAGIVRQIGFDFGRQLAARRGSPRHSSQNATNDGAGD